MIAPLPIDERLDEIVARVREAGAAVVVAPPGAGKTTRVAPRLAEDGPTILLQPRRIAARSLARRIAAERGWTVGREVGWQVRFERRFGSDTRLLVATEGVLTARLQSDPLLGDFRTVVLDEFHERSLHADLALALVREARAARDDLRVVVMSATLDARPVAGYLDCPVIEVAARAHPLEIEYAGALDPASACRRALEHADGHVLCFLPGAPEIERLRRELEPRLPPGVDLFPLYGSLEASAQDAALASTQRRKLILATNLAETSLTIDGVSEVVDTGLHKVLRLDPAVGIDRLEIERVSRDSADQRAGRAGRTGPGRVLRLWDERDELAGAAQAVSSTRIVSHLAIRPSFPAVGESGQSDRPSTDSNADPIFDCWQFTLVESEKEQWRPIPKCSPIPDPTRRPISSRVSSAASAAR